jgi:hypothetical protein
MRPELDLLNASVVGLICSESTVDRLPVHPWAIDAALAELATDVEPGSALDRAIQRWPRDDRGPGLRFLGLQALLWELAAAGHIRPTGEGSAAHYTLSPEWRYQHRRLHAALSRRERAAVGRAAGHLAYLVAKSTTRSKSAERAAPLQPSASS